MIDSISTMKEVIIKRGDNREIIGMKVKVSSTVDHDHFKDDPRILGREFVAVDQSVGGDLIILKPLGRKRKDDFTTYAFITTPYITQKLKGDMALDKRESMLVLRIVE